MNDQTKAWQGEMGDAYTARQSLTLHSRKAMFSRIIAATRHTIKSVIEFGAGSGENMEALRPLLIGAHLTGVEVNNAAFLQLKERCDLAFHCSMLDFPGHGYWDLAFTRGCLIHIAPENLERAYDALYNAAKHYVLVAEYYSPTPTMVPYRGEPDLLWKRDFAGEMLDRYERLRLVDYGFIYHRDGTVPQDDVTWFLMEKDLC